MKFCDADACPSCVLAANEQACLRHKAEFCAWLSANLSNSTVSAALEKLSADLMQEAAALKREKAIISG